MDAETTAYLKKEVNSEFARFEERSKPESFDALPDIPAGRYISDDFFMSIQTYIKILNWVWKMNNY